MSLWPHQIRAFNGTRQAFAQGFSKPCVVGYMGSGKTRILSEITERSAKRGNSVLVLTDRKFLCGQLSDALTQHGIDHGVIDAENDEWSHRVVIAMIQSYTSKYVKKGRTLRFTMVIVDEAHKFNNATGHKALEPFDKRIGFTATPVDIGSLFDCLVDGGQPSELINQGVVVPCKVYAPSEADLKGLATSGDDWSGPKMSDRMSLVFGDMYEHFEILNPFHLPTLVFAPSIKHSHGIIEEFECRGISAAHIDGGSSNTERKEILQAHKERDITIVSSVGVLREGVNMPWARVGVLLQATRKVSTYLQIVGRLLRSDENKDHATLMDHTGAWHRHGPPDMDRQWELTCNDTQLREQRQDKLKKGKEREGICCKKCNHVFQWEPGWDRVCPSCKGEFKQSVRRVRQQDGQLKEMRGPVYHKPKKQRSDEDAWKSCLYACGNASTPKTLNQARAWFRREQGYSLPVDRIPEHLLPATETGWDRRVDSEFPWTNRRQHDKA